MKRSGTNRFVPDCFICRPCVHTWPAICVEESIADDLVALLVKYSKEAKLGKAYEKDTGLGPIVNAGHRDFINDWIETGVKEGAQLVLDGRNPDVPEDCKDGFWVGPTIFDHVTEEMSIGREEVFGREVIDFLAMGERNASAAVAQIKGKVRLFGLDAPKGERFVAEAARAPGQVRRCRRYNHSPFIRSTNACARLLRSEDDHRGNGISDRARTIRFQRIAS